MDNGQKDAAVGENRQSNAAAAVGGGEKYKLFVTYQFLFRMGPDIEPQFQFEIMTKTLVRLQYMGQPCNTFLNKTQRGPDGV